MSGIMTWEGGINWLPGLRIIPDSSVYTVRPQNVVVVVTTTAGVVIRCDVFSKFTTDELACFNWPKMMYLLQQRFTERSIAFTIAALTLHPPLTPTTVTYVPSDEMPT